MKDDDFLNKIGKAVNYLNIIEDITRETDRQILIKLRDHIENRLVTLEKEEKKK